MRAAVAVLLASGAHHRRAGRRRLLSERLAERGPFLKLMQWTSHVARRCGARDRVEHAAVDVFNGRLVGVRNHD